MAMTPDVAQFLRNMLAGQSIQVGSPDVVEVAQMARKALLQLDEVLDPVSTPNPAGLDLPKQAEVVQ